jgi:hypothetical protein
VGGDYQRLPRYREALAPTRAADSNNAFGELVCRALALGFGDKWVNASAEEKGGRATTTPDQE